MAAITFSFDTRHLTCDIRQLSRDKYFMQYMIHVVLWGVYCLSYFASFQSSVCQYEFAYFSDIFLSGNHFRSSGSAEQWLFKIRLETMLKLVKTLFYGRHWMRCEHSTCYYLATAYKRFSNVISLQKEESNHLPKLLLFHSSKIRGHDLFHTRSK